MPHRKPRVFSGKYFFMTQFTSLILLLIRQFPHHNDDEQAIKAGECTLSLVGKD
jgi:hypothetical protein